MTADYSTNICIDGTTEELLAMLAVVRKYLPDPPKYRPDIRFDWVEIWRKSDKSTFYLEKLYGMNEEEQQQFLDTFEGKLSISAAGPFGYFDLISSIPLFYDMADAAPNASFDGSISGYTSYDESELEAELKDGKLRIIDRYRDNEGYSYEKESVYDVSANSDTNAEDVTNTPESDGPPTQCPHCKGEHLVLQQGKMRKHFQQILQTDSKGKEIYVCEDCEAILVR